MDKMNKKIIGALVIIVSSFGVSLSSAEAQTSTRPMPGYWNFSTTAAGLFKDSDDHCLSQAEVDRFYSNPCKKNSVCVYKTKTMQSDGTVVLDGTWTDRKKRVTKIKANGKLVADKMVLKGTANQFGLAIPFNFTATRVSGVCK